jgi:hypothetical protein
VGTVVQIDEERIQPHLVEMVNHTSASRHAMPQTDKGQSDKIWSLSKKDKLPKLRIIRQSR